jgi:hypothetical protein
MKHRFVIPALLSIISLTATPSAEANTTVHFPDGSVAFAQLVNTNQLAFIFWDTATTGDNDIFTLHSNSIANPTFLFLGGEPNGGLSYWLDFIGLDMFGNMIFNVRVNQGAGWFYVGQYLL